MRALGFGAMVLLSAAVLVAQERPRAEQREQRSEQRQQRVQANRPVGAPANADQTIAQCLAISNAEEVALGTLAAAKSQNPRIKQFAETIVKDHGQMIASLQKFGAQPTPLARAAGAADANADGRPDRAVERREARREGDPAVAERRTSASRDGLDFVAIKQQMAEKCLETAEKNWATLEPKEADMCFAGQQAVLHQQMLDGLQVLRPYASPELQATLDQGIQTTQSHLEHAKNLIKQLTSAEGAPAREPAVPQN
jgi:predicted outer membrane protein